MAASSKKKPPKKLVLKGKPNPRQEEFFLSEHKFTAYGGSRGGG